jgi:hypothetical protein
MDSLYRLSYIVKSLENQGFFILLYSVIFAYLQIR